MRQLDLEHAEQAQREEHQNGAHRQIEPDVIRQGDDEVAVPQHELDAQVVAVALAELLLVEKLGPRTLQSLALVAEVIHGTPCRFDDPARFSFAHGGKDGHPFPVPLKTYDESLNFLRAALDRAKAVRTGGDSGRVEFGREKLHALRRLDRFARSVENRLQPRADFDAVIAHERSISRSLDGRTVMDDKPGRFFVGRSRQRSLFNRQD